MRDITWIQPYYDIVLDFVPLNTESLIDVGSGYGIFGYILSKTRSIKSLVSIEPFEYESSHYSMHHRMTWQKWYHQNQDKVNVIVSTEMIEHMTKEDALLFLRQTKNRADTVIIATPYKFEKQEAYDSNEYQIHRSVISAANFINEGYTVYLLGTFRMKGLSARILYHHKWQRFLKVLGVTPTNIIGVYK